MDSNELKYCTLIEYHYIHCKKFHIFLRRQNGMHACDLPAPITRWILKPQGNDIKRWAPWNTISPQGQSLEDWVQFLYKGDYKRARNIFDVPTCS